MTPKKHIKFFIDENQSKPPKTNRSTNKTDVCHFDDIRSLDTFDLKDYGLESSRSCRYVSIVIDNSSKFGWKVPLKKIISLTTRNFFEKILVSSKESLNLIKTDRGKEFF